MREVQNNRFGLTALLMFAVVTTLLSGSVNAGMNLPDFTSLVVKNGPAVVNISTTSKIRSASQGIPGFDLPELPEGHPLNELFKHFFNQQGQEPSNPTPESDESTSLGSGFIISSDGYILTNYHVINEAEEIIVRLADRRQLTAEVVGTDQRSDMALLRIKADHLPVVKIGKSSSLKVGEWVLAIGSPFGFDHSVTAGIVSAKERALPSENYVPFIQTDVAINPGNSGGPLFNLKGEVVGINSQIYSRTGGFMGLSFAIPIDVAMEVVRQLKTKGRVTRGWLGVLIQDVDRDLAESFGMKKPQGALISQVLKNSPAKASGLHVGDIIVEFNGRAVHTSASLPPMVGRIHAGDRIKVMVIRQGRRVEVPILIGELPEEDQEVVTQKEKPKASKNRLNVTVAELTPKQRNELDIRKGGVMIVAVAQGPAAKAGVRRGDVILMLNNKELGSVREFNEVVKKLPAGRQLPMLLQRRNGSLFLALKITE